MATNPRKTPNDAALSAVEEALRLDFGAAEEGERERSASRRPPEPRAPEPRPPAADANRRPDMAPASAGGAADPRPAPPRRAAAAAAPAGAAHRPTPNRRRSNCRRRPRPRPQPQPQQPQPPPRPRAAEQRGRGRFAANDDRRRGAADRRLSAPPVAPDLSGGDGRLRPLGGRSSSASASPAMPSAADSR